MKFFNGTIRFLKIVSLMIIAALFVGLLFSSLFVAIVSKNENIILKNLSNWSTLFGSLAVIAAIGMYFIQLSQQQKLDFQRASDLILKFYENGMKYWGEAEALPTPDDPYRDVKNSIWRMRGITHLVEAEMILRQMEKFKGLTDEEKEIITGQLGDALAGTVEVMKLINPSGKTFHTNGLPRVTKLLNEGE